MRGKPSWEERGLAASGDILLWASFMLLWLGGVLSGMQQCLQTLKHLLPALARSFFFNLSWQLLVLVFLVIRLTLGLHLFCFQPPGPDDVLGPPKDDRAVPDTG